MKGVVRKYPVCFLVICFAFVGIILLFVCSCSNHYFVNKNSQIYIENLSNDFRKTKADIKVVIDSMSCGYIPENNMQEVSKELNSLLIDIEETKCEMIKQHQNIFDANTVTFLITFLSALLFTVFITLFIKNMELFRELSDYNERIKDADEKIENADSKIEEVDNRIAEVDNRIAEAKADWDKKLQCQEYLVNIAAERNRLTQILSLVSVLGSHLASSNYVIKEEYVTLVYMIQRKTQSLYDDGLKNIKVIRLEDQNEFMKIITDCITYLNIDTLRENNEDGLVPFEQLNGYLDEIQSMIKKIPLQEKK